jgi:hypothetical protein
MRDLTIGNEYQVLVNDNWEKAILSDLKTNFAKFTSLDNKLQWYFTKLEGYIKVPELTKSN